TSLAPTSRLPLSAPGTGLARSVHRGPAQRFRAGPLGWRASERTLHGIEGIGGKGGGGGGTGRGSRHRVIGGSASRGVGSAAAGGVADLRGRIRLLRDRGGTSAIAARRRGTRAGEPERATVAVPRGRGQDPPGRGP